MIKPLGAFLFHLLCWFRLCFVLLCLYYKRFHLCCQYVL
nr:MAG TPA: hypothetical protein [Caudoviricetes sp.]